MLGDDCRPHFISALRQSLRSAVPVDVETVLWGIEKMAVDCLDDMVPPTLDLATKLARLNAGRPYSKPHWELTRADGPFSVGELLTTLKSLYNSAENGDERCPPEKIRMWYAAAEVLRYCIDIRARGLNQQNLDWLADAMHGLPALPTAKAGKLKDRSPAPVEPPGPDTEQANTGSGPEAHRADKQTSTDAEEPTEAQARLVIELGARRVLIDGVVQVVPAQPFKLLVLLAQSTKDLKGPVTNTVIETSTGRVARELVSDLRNKLKANRRNAQEIHKWIAARRSFLAFEIVLAPEQIEIRP